MSDAVMFTTFVTLCYKRLGSHTRGSGGLLRDSQRGNQIAGVPASSPLPLGEGDTPLSVCWCGLFGVGQAMGNL